MKKDLFDSNGNWVGTFEDNSGNPLAALGVMAMLLGMLALVFCVVLVPLSIFYFTYKGLVAL